ncbi:MAG: glucuronate isomerase, partial [Verrucomicrobiota bacterium]
MLQSPAAQELYDEFARDQPIIDFHNHLPPDEIAEDKTFANMREIWLAGDHYKWRAMRANGIDESLITGDASDREKYDAWAETVPHTLRNALYHWTHLELTRYFDFPELFSPDTADALWDKGNALLQTPEFSCRGLLRQMKVKALCTTDDPTDPLLHHQSIASDPTCSDIKVYPTFRPDVGLLVNDSSRFNEWVDKLAAISDQSCDKLADFVAALKSRHDFFHSIGGRLSDHGLLHLYESAPNESAAAKVFDKARSGKDADAAETDAFGAYLMNQVGQWNFEKGWTMQLHMGPTRNNRTRLFDQAGRDAGGDAMTDSPQVHALQRFMDHLDQSAGLPKMIIYNLNPKENYPFATLMGN